MLGGREVDCVAAPGDQPVEEPTSPPFDDDVRKTLARIDPGDRQRVIDSLLAAGIEANRWTCPDLAQQLRTLGDAKIKAVFCCAIDLDSALPIQDSLLAEHAMEIAAGVTGLARLLGTTTRVLALAEDSRNKVVAAMKSAAAATDLRLDPLLVEYPLAHPKIVMRRSLGVRIAHRCIADTGGRHLPRCAGRAGNWPVLPARAHVTRIPVGIYDRRFNRSHLAWIPVGMSLGDLLAALDLSVRSTDLFTGHMLLDRPAQPSDIFTAASEYAVFASDHHAR